MPPTLDAAALERMCLHSGGYATPSFNEALRLRGLGISSLEGVALAAYSELKALDLSSNLLGDLRGLPRLPSLTVLSIAENQLCSFDGIWDAADGVIETEKAHCAVGEGDGKVEDESGDTAGDGEEARQHGGRGVVWTSGKPGRIDDADRDEGGVSDRARGDTGERPASNRAVMATGTSDPSARGAPASPSLSSPTPSVPRGAPARAPPIHGDGSDDDAPRAAVWPPCHVPPPGTSRLPRLRSLDVSGNRLASLGRLAAGCPRLERLDLSRNNIRDAAEIGTLSSCPALLHLDLSGNAFPDGAELVETLAWATPGLVALELGVSQAARIEVGGTRGPRGGAGRGGASIGVGDGMRRGEATGEAPEGGMPEEGATPGAQPRATCEAPPCARLVDPCVPGNRSLPGPHGRSSSPSAPALPPSSPSAPAHPLSSPSTPGPPPGDPLRLPASSWARRRLILAALPSLVNLDGLPVTAADRAAADAWKVGGPREENAARWRVQEASEARRREAVRFVLSTIAGSAGNRREREPRGEGGGDGGWGESEVGGRAGGEESLARTRGGADKLVLGGADKLVLGDVALDVLGASLPWSIRDVGATATEESGVGQTFRRASKKPPEGGPLPETSSGDDVRAREGSGEASACDEGASTSDDRLGSDAAALAEQLRSMLPLGPAPGVAAGTVAEAAPVGDPLATSV